MRWVLAAIAAALVAGYTCTDVAEKQLLDEDWQPDGDDEDF